MFFTRRYGPTRANPYLLCFKCELHVLGPIEWTVGSGSTTGVEMPCPKCKRLYKPYGYKDFTEPKPQRLN